MGSVCHPKKCLYLQDFQSGIDVVSCPDHTEKRVVWEHCYFEFVLPLMRFIHSYVRDICYLSDLK